MKKNIYILLAAAFCGGLLSCGRNDKATTLVDSSALSTQTVLPFAPIDKGNGIYAFEFNGLYFEADANNAGRISAFGLNGKNMLSTKEVNATNWGTSLWPSPQSAWGWPPSKELDVLAYSGGIKDSVSIELVSKKDSLLGIVFTKNYKISTTDTAILVSYTITNNSAKAQSLAPWEISRVAPGGLTFYPTGKGTKQNLLAPLMVDKEGVTWFDYDSLKMNFKPSDVPKLMHDGAEGWMAQITGNLILIKKFNDITPEKTAPGEGEIEFYANPDKSYIEIEQQGEYTLLPVGGSLTWEVKWFVRTLPVGVKPEVGNKLLLDFVRKTIQ